MYSRIDLIVRTDINYSPLEHQMSWVSVQVWSKDVYRMPNNWTNFFSYDLVCFHRRTNCARSIGEYLTRGPPIECNYVIAGMFDLRFDVLYVLVRQKSNIYLFLWSFQNTRGRVYTFKWDQKTFIFCQIIAQTLPLWLSMFLLWDQSLSMNSFDTWISYREQLQIFCGMICWYGTTAAMVHFWTAEVEKDHCSYSAVYMFRSNLICI